jgi:hypothetical protein
LVEKIPYIHIFGFKLLLNKSDHIKEFRTSLSKQHTNNFIRLKMYHQFHSWYSLEYMHMLKINSALFVTLHRRFISGGLYNSKTKPPGIKIIHCSFIFHWTNLLITCSIYHIIYEYFLLLHKSLITKLFQALQWTQSSIWKFIYDRLFPCN